MVILHGYVLRELLKTFVLTAAALTGLFTMGGGLYNIIRNEGMSAADLLRVVPLLIPIVVTLTMPVAALFATTLVYGRLAADNELTACRAAGINVHRLFLAAMLLAVFVTLFTLLSGNYVIPRFMRQIENYTRSNIRDLTAQQLRQKGYMRVRNELFITAERVLGVTDAELERKHFATGPGLSYLVVDRPAFLQLSRSGDLERFTTADFGLCQFDTRGETISITAYVRSGRDYEVGKRAAEIVEQRIGPYAAAIAFPARPSWQDLPTLVLWLREPTRWEKLAGRTAAFLAGLSRERFAAECATQVQSGRPIGLKNAHGERFDISAGSATADRDGVRLSDARVRVSRPDDESRSTLYEAARAELIVRGSTAEAQDVELRLLDAPQQPVREFQLREGQRGSPRDRSTLTVEAIELPPSVRQQVSAISPAMLLEPAIETPLSPELAEERARLVREGEQFVRRIRALIHFRLGYAGSALVTVLMAAALGVVFRGSRALAAFGLSCIPFGTVTLLAVMGRQLGEGASTAAAGPIVTWGGLGLVALIDLIILRLGVRR